jgi:putative peptidoglycan lipid II flippase
VTERRRSILTTNLGKAALIVSGGILASRLLGQIRESLFAAMLGATDVTDQYVAAFRIPDFLNYLLAGGFLAITFVPIFTKYLADDDERGGWVALTAVIRPLTIGIVGLVVVGWIAAPWFIETLYPNFTPEQIDNTIRLTRIVLPAQIFFVVGALFVAVQYAMGVFTIPAIAPVAYNLGIIAGGVGYALITGEPDPEGFAWGALAGAFVGNFALQWWGARRLGMRLIRGTPWGNPVIWEYAKIAFPLMIGQSIVVLDETYMSIFGDFAGDGAQTQLQYARRTMLVPVGVVAQAAGVAAYPFMARLFAEGRLREMADTVDRAMRWVVVLSLGATGLLAALSVPTIRVLFERFNFTQLDTDKTASVLVVYAFAIPVWGALAVLTRAFYARRQMWTPVIVGTVAAIIAIPLYALLQDRLGIEGVALSSVLTLGGYTVVLGYLWYREPDHRSRASDVLTGAIRGIPLALAGAIVAIAVSWALGEALPEGFIASLFQVAGGSAAFAAVVFLAGGLLYGVAGPGPGAPPVDEPELAATATPDGPPKTEA